MTTAARAARLFLALLIGTAIGACGRGSVQSFDADSYPNTLSAWGVVVVQGATLQPGVSVVPYDLATPLFTDHAHKLRTIWLPRGTVAQPDTDGMFQLPVGSILSKTFYYPRDDADARAVAITDDHTADFAGEGLDLSRVRLIETRLLVHQPHGWDAMTYVWDSAQREARLAIAGDVMSLATHDGGFTYLVPTRNECATCHASDHTSGKLLPIGIATRHLDKEYAFYRDGAVPQLERWLALGLIDRQPTVAIRNAVWRANAFDDLDVRARSYLDINCGHCHNPSGSADTSGLFLDRATPLSRALGVCKPPIAAGRGSGGHAYSIVPGDAGASIVVHRMASTDPAVMMPEIGRTTVHEAAVVLIRRWVDSLTPAGCDRTPAL